MLQKTNPIWAFAIAIITIISFSFYFSSCKKNKECKANVKVVDAATGAPVVGATVVMAPSKTAPQGNLPTQNQTKTTDGSGSVSFTFKDPAILEASVTPPSPYSSGPFTGLVKLEEGKTSDKSIKVN